MSKWILIFAEDNDISEPEVYDTYEQAYEKMKRQFNKLKTIDDCANIHKDYASIQSDCDIFDWRIFEVKA